MPDWDETSLQLQQNVVFLLTRISLLAPKRELPSLQTAQVWHRDLLQGLSVPSESFRGAFRGAPGLENLDIQIGTDVGVAARDVAVELSRFESKLHTLLSELDAAVPHGKSPTAKQLGAILDLAAWVHAEWVRIHPFANANGRIARLWANSVVMRYGLPPFLPLRPRPGTAYEEAASAAMRGDWRPTAIVFRDQFFQAVEPR